MAISRRNLLLASGSLFMTIKFPVLAAEQKPVVIQMRGTARGERVWFGPAGIAVAPGTTLRFINLDPANSHTVTAYHPDFFGRTRRIPQRATPFHSGYLLPENVFEVTLTVSGVYDYYCVPHEMAGMVGRIIVGTPDMEGWDETALRAGGVAENVEKRFPAIRQLLSDDPVRRIK
ncbi:MAG: hypothetical protein KBT83_03190 [Marinobacter sp.]|nr:hypothetical protein [Marinobacter sp.]